jgi:hypothetical protein
MFGLLIIFSQLWGEPWDGTKARLLEGRTAGPHHGTWAWGSLLPVPGPRAAQRPLRRALLSTVDAPQSACRGEDHTSGVRPDAAFSCATLRVAPTSAGVGVTEGHCHRPAGTIGGEEGLGAPGEIGGDKGRDRRRGRRWPARGGLPWA